MANHFKKAMFFKIDNKRDKCAFCAAKGLMVMGMASGLCICPSCAADLRKAIQPEQLRLEHKPDFNQGEIA